MASSAGNVKQKKPPVMYVYKLDTGNLKPPSESDPSSKKATSWGLGMGSLRRSKTTREVNHRRMNKVVEDTEESRKSVSSEAAAGKSVSDLKYDGRRIMMNKVVEDVKEIHHVEARKSVSMSEAAAAEGRKSVSHVEVNAAAVAAFLQVKVLVSDMPAFMQVHAFRCARRTYDSLEQFSSKHMAYNLKKEFDKVYGPAWHCIVGSSFGSFVTHSTGGFLYFSMEKLYILVFKTKVQRAQDP